MLFVLLNLQVPPVSVHASGQLLSGTAKVKWNILRIKHVYPIYYCVNCIYLLELCTFFIMIIISKNKRFKSKWLILSQTLLNGTYSNLVNQNYTKSIVKVIIFKLIKEITKP